MSRTKVLSLALPKSRLRKNGVTVSSANIDESILALIKISPKTPSEIASEYGKSRQWAQMKLKFFLNDNKVCKVESTGRYQLANQKKTFKDIKHNEITKSKFYNECETVKKMYSKMTADSADMFMTKFANICLGITAPEFKIHPDFWNHPETTLECVKALKKVTGKDQLGGSIRQTLRYFINLGLEISTSKAENKQLGLEGDKGKPQVSDLEMSREQYDKVMKITKDAKYYYSWNNDFIKFGVRYWTSIRISASFAIEMNNIKFFDRKQIYVELNNEKIFNSKVIDFIKNISIIMPDIKDKIPIKELITRSCSIKFLEFKTDDWYTKQVLDADFVVDFEKFCKKRNFQKKKYLFWDDNSTIFERKTYKKVTWQAQNVDNKHFKKLFFKIGFKHGDFGKIDRANYAIRHFSFQNWLQLTEYDYAFVGSASHKDLATLKDWYGKMSETHIQEKLKEIVF